MRPTRIRDKNMKQFKTVTILTLIVSALFLAGCYKEDESSKKKSGFTSPEEYIENPSVIKAINESDIPVYQGTNPPALAGTYILNGYITDVSSALYKLMGRPIQTEFIFSKQTNSGKIDCEERAGGIKVSGSGGYITGNNGRFTIYQESRQSGTEAGLPNGVSITVVLLMSGTKSSNGNLVNVEGISIITEVNNSQYKSAEGGWWKWEANFYLQ